MSTKQSDNIGKAILVLLFCGGAPLFFMHGEWAKVLLKAYLLTVGVFFVVIFAYWESIREAWLWKAMVLFAVIHSCIILGMIALNLNFPWIDRLPRVAYAAVAWVALAETLLALAIIRRFRSRVDR